MITQKDMLAHARSYRVNELFPYKREGCPKIVSIGGSEVDELLRCAEEETGFLLDLEELLSKLFSIIKNKETALIDVDYYCLEQFRSVHMADYPELRIFYSIFRDVAASLIRNLTQHDLYVNGLLDYVYCGRRGTSLLLLQRKFLNDTIRAEFSENNAVSNSS